MKKIILLCSLLFTCLNMIAQDLKYPQNYFTWPVAAEQGLAANFGELRPNHFHMGLDCRTAQRENIPVYAAADGYIAKVKIESGGFGRAIYINHPNGLTTLYAHLNAFYPSLEAYIKKQQYSQEKWNVFIDVPAGLLPVKKGSFIANSGNTGGSQGPHLHFEIRDTESDKVLNPLLFGFPVRDNIPPDIIRLYVYDRCISTYEQSPKPIFLKKQNGVYVASNEKIILNTDRISFGITAYDRYTGSTNQNGIYAAFVTDNGITRSKFVMDSINYDETRYLNAHIDYKTKTAGGSYIQHLSKLPGNYGIIYKGLEDGVISLEDEMEHAIEINVSDAAGNKSVIRLKVQAGNSRTPSIASSGTTLFAPGFVNVLENEKVRLVLGEKCLYDSFRFRYANFSGKNGTVHQLHTALVPVHQYFPVSIKPDFMVSDTGKIIMKRSYGTKEDFTDANFNNGWFTAYFRELGNFELIVDETPPVISAVSISRKRIVFSIVDNTKNLKNFKPLLNGKWIRFSNDKGRTFIYEIDENVQTGNNLLQIVVEDMAGNIAERTVNFTH